MSPFAGEVENDTQVIPKGEEWRRRVGERELAHWTEAVERLLSLSDAALDELERLNLADQTQAPQDLERTTLRLIWMADVEPGAARTVQGLLDALFEVQESILLELHACRGEAQARARRWRAQAVPNRPRVLREASCAGPAPGAAQRPGGRSVDPTPARADQRSERPSFLTRSTLSPAASASP